MFYPPMAPPPYMATEEQMVSYRNLCDEQDRKLWLEFRIMMATVGLCLVMVTSAVVWGLLR